jgi:hypothetical protein
MQSIVSLTLIVQAQEQMAAGRYREAGRLVLEAADVITTPEDADEVAELCELAMEHCGFVQRGRFESALEYAEERRAELTATAPR